MNRLRSIQGILLLALLPVWALFFVLNLRQVLHHQMVIVPIFVSMPQADEYPSVRGLRVGAIDPATDIETGDRLIHAGTADLRGQGPLGFRARVYEQAHSTKKVSILLQRGQEKREVVLALPPLAGTWGTLFESLSFAFVGSLFLFRVRPSRSTRLIYLGFMCLATVVASFPGPGVQPYLWIIVILISGTVCGPLLLYAAESLTGETETAPKRLPLWPLLFSVNGLITSSWALGWPLPFEIGLKLNLIDNATFYAAVIFVLVKNYRRADSAGRRKLKWVVYGFFVGIVPSLVASIVAGLVPALSWIPDASGFTAMFLPICVFVASARFRLFDVDRLISATATYTILTILLVTGLLALAPKMAQAATLATGLNTATGEALFGFLLACLIVPGQRFLRPKFDRIFFAERRALEQGIEQLLEDLSASEGPENLLATAGERLDRLLHPACCVIYARADDAFTAVFTRGQNTPPSFVAGTPLLSRLERRNLALSLEDQPRRSVDAAGEKTERASLAALRAELLLPIKHRGLLTAFVCLGKKRSGDVYIDADLALLAAVANKISSELRRFDVDEVRKQARLIQESLRRYVPGAVAEHLEQGHELEAATREVTIMFVDIRGYTSYSESRTATEIFSVINAYTEAVSSIVRRHQGSVMQFSGDGLMVVFGAPDAIADKERAAVAASIEIITSLRSLALGSDVGDGTGLEVGIGIATGQAFLGNIQAVDRMIWGAVGNTTNLAARLQSLSRNLNAEIVIDAATHLAAGELTENFVCHEGTRIRGLKHPENVYAFTTDIPGYEAERMRL